jgi:hypothetical protein
MSQQAWLIFLLLFWGILLFGGFVSGSDQDGRRMPAWTRLGSSAVLVVSGFSWALISRDDPTATYALLLALGMTMGFAGDLLLAQVLIRGRKSQLGGIAAFTAGHLFYIPAIWQLGQQLGLTQNGARFGSLLAWWLLTLLGWIFVVYSGRNGTALQWIVLPYALLLATTAGLASGLALQAPAFWMLAAGSALFLFSDMLIAGNWFSRLDFPMIHDLIWLTYGPGQMLIVYSAGAALQLTLV